MPSSACTSSTAIYTLSLHDALPIWRRSCRPVSRGWTFWGTSIPFPSSSPSSPTAAPASAPRPVWLSGTRGNCVLCASWLKVWRDTTDRKSTRLNSSHTVISYAVFCLHLQHRDLHSFPTRRSSDLEEVVQAGIEGLDVLGNIDSIPLIEPFLADGRPGIRAQACLALWNQGELRVVRKLAESLEGHDRSEEHTSELQSHSDLVCRLLLAPPAPRSTLFPYTTLFRSGGGRAGRYRGVGRSGEHRFHSPHRALPRRRPPRHPRPGLSGSLEPGGIACCAQAG